MPLFRKFNPRKVNPTAKKHHHKQDGGDSSGKGVFRRGQRIPITKVLLGAFLLYNVLGTVKGWWQRWRRHRQLQQRQQQQQEEEDFDEEEQELAPEVAAAEGKLQQVRWPPDHAGAGSGGRASCRPAFCGVGTSWLITRLARAAQALLPAMMRAALPKPQRSNAARQQAQAHKARQRHVPTASKMMQPVRRVWVWGGGARCDEARRRARPAGRRQTTQPESAPWGRKEGRKVWNWPAAGRQAAREAAALAWQGARRRHVRPPRRAARHQQMRLQLRPARPCGALPAWRRALTSSGGSQACSASWTRPCGNRCAPMASGPPPAEAMPTPPYGHQQTGLRLLSRGGDGTKNHQQQGTRAASARLASTSGFGLSVLQRVVSPVQVRDLVLAQEQAHQLQLEAAKRVLALQAGTAANHGAAAAAPAADGKPHAAAGAAGRGPPLVQPAATPVRRR